VGKLEAIEQRLADAWQEEVSVATGISCRITGCLRFSPAWRPGQVPLGSGAKHAGSLKAPVQAAKIFHTSSLLDINALERLKDAGMTAVLTSHTHDDRLVRHERGTICSHQLRDGCG
jgi:hypothetical protein